jgi:hypothetical protein
LPAWEFPLSILYEEEGHEAQGKGRSAKKKKKWVRRQSHTHKCLANADVFTSVSIHTHKHTRKQHLKEKRKMLLAGKTEEEFREKEQKQTNKIINILKPSFQEDCARIQVVNRASCCNNHIHHIKAKEKKEQTRGRNHDAVIPVLMEISSSNHGKLIQMYWHEYRGRVHLKKKCLVLKNSIRTKQ